MVKPVASMTGFARTEADHLGQRIVWELRSVNGKGLDLRLRLPPGSEALEVEVRRRAAAHVSRGNIQIGLQIQRTAMPAQRLINSELLMRYVAEAARLVSEGHASPPTADGLLALRGVLDTAPDDSITEDRALDQAAIDAFDQAVSALATARQAEGAEIAAALGRRLDAIERLTDAATGDAARKPDTIKARLRAQIAALADSGIDEARLAQEAALLATRADIQEELDRLRAHIAAGRALLAEGGPVGRRLEFLSQEFNRESNTLCSKSNATSLTAIGLELKIVVDQFREQVQNIE